MDEITFDDKTYVSSKRAAAITGYAKDYVGQLCREGRVEARLVGRNWYILETSIRDHRFGKEAVKPSGKDENGQWNAPSYAPDVVSTLPTISPVATVEPVHVQSVPETSHEIQHAGLQATASEPSLDHSTTIQEMQDAWQDWFTNKTPSPNTPSEEPIQERREPHPLETVHLTRVIEKEEVPQEPVYATQNSYSAPAQSVEEYAVPIHRSFSRPIDEIVPVQRTAEPQTQYDQSSYVQPTLSYEPVYGAPRAEGRILRERRVIKKKKPSVALQALFLVLAAAAIGVALIGTGKIDGFLTQNRIQYAPINYLGGENIVNK
jgi:hypothetical protein